MMTIENFQHLLLLALLLLVVTWPLSRICAWLRQPLVIAEILAGITLGPSVLGAIAPPAAESDVVPTGVTPMLACRLRRASLFASSQTTVVEAPISISESRPNPASATECAESAATASTPIAVTFHASVASSS